MDDHDYAALPSMLEDVDEAEARELDPSTLTDPESANAPFTLEERGSHASLRIENLDKWFAALYAYFEGKGFWCIVTSRVVNVLTLGFTVAFSAFLLLYVDWETLRTECAEASLRSSGATRRDDATADATADALREKDTCDILRDATYASPLSHRGFVANFLVLAYLVLFTAYLVWTIARLVVDVKPLLEMRAFCVRKLQLSDGDIQTVAWPEVVARVVHLQATTRLCIAKDLNEHDIVARILREENYLLGMLNRDVLGLRFETGPKRTDAGRGGGGFFVERVPGVAAFRRRVWFTKTVEWNVRQAIFSGMFDDDFSIRPQFYDVDALRHRMRVLAAVNLVLSPFVAAFLVVFFLLHHVERFYHDPGSAGQRQWSTLARWQMREFNELPHFLDQRLKAAHRPATKYVAQFSSPVAALAAKFASYVVGAFVAFALACTLLLDDRLLHAEVFGRDLLWHTAVAGAVLAFCRNLHGDADSRAFEPRRWMAETVAHTHFLPKRWRDVAHRRDTLTEFSELFRFKSAVFFEELLSVFVTPFLLWGPLSSRAPEIVQFARQFTTTAGGVGAVCSLSAFDFAKHGNGRYGAPRTARKQSRSKQGKMEKSFLSFTARYPTWEPGESGREFLRNVRRFAEETQRARRAENLRLKTKKAPRSEERFSLLRTRAAEASATTGGSRRQTAGASSAAYTTPTSFTTPKATRRIRDRRLVFSATVAYSTRGAARGERGDGRVFGAPDERREAQTQALLQRAYESRAFETESRESRHDVSLVASLPLVSFRESRSEFGIRGIRAASRNGARLAFRARLETQRARGDGDVCVGLCVPSGAAGAAALRRAAQPVGAGGGGGSAREAVTPARRVSTCNDHDV
jgi:autophagy-related protein 9